MKFNHNVYHNGKMYLAGEDVPIDEPTAKTESPKPEKVADSPAIEEAKADTPAKTVKKK